MSGLGGDTDWQHLLGVTPEVVHRPTDSEQLRELVAHAAEQGKTLIPLGGGCGQDYGNVPRNADWILDLSLLNRVVAHNHEDMTVTVEPGVTVDALQRHLATRGQFLPLDPPDSERATMGGVVSVDAWSSLSLGYGRCRDWLIGVRVVDAGGRAVRGGGNVVKNVTGYDLPKLYCGALGTLAILTELTFKVAPRPEAVRTVVVRCQGSVPALVALDLLRTGSPVSVTLHSEPGGSRHLVAIHHGAVEAVDSAVQRLQRLLADHGAGPVGVVAEDLAPELPDAAIELRVAGLPNDVVALAEALEAEAADSGAVLLARLGIGDVRCVWTDDSEASRAAMARLRAFASVRGLRCVLHHAPADLRSLEEPDCWLPLPATLPLQRQLKHSLDPDGLLNPGRFAGRL